MEISAAMDRDHLLNFIPGLLEKGFYFSKNVILAALCLVGALLIPELNFQLNPSPKSQSLSVSFYFFNASPELVENEATAPLESVLATLPHLTRIRSTSSFGHGQIQLDFDPYADMEPIRFAVSMLLRQVYPNLQPGISFPEVQYDSPFSDHPMLLVYHLSSEQPPERFKAFVEDQLLPSLSKLKGVYKVDLSGFPEEELNVILESEKIRALQISENEVLQAIRESIQSRDLNVVATAAAHGEEAHWISLKFQTALEEEDPLAFLPQVPVAKKENRVVYLRDLAKVFISEKAPERYFRVNGQQAVSLVLFSEQGVNQIQLAKKARAVLDGIQAAHLNEIQIKLIQDNTLFLQTELFKIGKRAGFALVLLLLFVIGVYPQWRFAALIWLSLFATLLLSNILYYLFQLELHLYSIAAWTMSIGLVLDNVFVMASHLHRRQRSPVFLAILAATLTTVGGLTAGFFLEENARSSISEFNKIFIINLLTSLVIALIFVPSLSAALKTRAAQKQSSRWARRWIVRHTAWYEKYIFFSLRMKWVWAVVLVLGFGFPFVLLPRKIEQTGKAAQWYNQHIGSPAFQDKILPIANKWLGGAFYRFFQKKDDFFFGIIKQSRPYLHLEAKMPYGGTVDQLNEILRPFEKQLEGEKAVEMFQTRIEGPQNASMEVVFRKEYEKSGFPFFLKQRFEDLAIATGSADFRIYGVGDIGFNNEVSGEELRDHLQLLGYDYDRLWELAFQIRSELEKEMRIREVFIVSRPSQFAPSEEYYAVQFPDMAFLSREGLSHAKLGKAFQELNYDKGAAGRWIGARRTPVHVVSDDREENQMWFVMNRPQIDWADTTVFKNKQVLQLAKEKGILEIVRINQQYQLVLNYTFIGQYDLAKQVKEDLIRNWTLQLPKGYALEEVEDSYIEERKGGGALLAILAGLAGIFAIAAVLFNSLRSAFVPLVLVIPSFTGIFLGVYLFDFRFDGGGLASFLVTAGLCVNGPLFIINDYFNQRKRRSSLSPVRCFLKAFHSKIIPILLSGFSTILGLFPFVLFDKGQDFWYALAICSISGIVFSLLSTYLLLPVLFFFGKKNSKPGANLLTTND